MYCDTSFLFSLYGRDKFGAQALREVALAQRPLNISILNEFELENSIRLAVFRKVMSPDQGSMMLRAFTADKEREAIRLVSCNLASVFVEAKRISSRHTMTNGHRSFDILHVAAALHLGAREFFTFDENQRKLAKAEGLKVLP